MDGGRDPAMVPSRPRTNPLLPYREDCWSEEETSVLVEAWGERYVELDRGNLRQKHWQEVADVVNSRRGSTGRRVPPRTHVQCKNRIDTLKKKYKLEKARAVPGAAASQWPFFSRLDDLICPSLVLAASFPAPTKKRSRSPPLALPLLFHHKDSPLPTAKAAVGPLVVKKRRTPAPAPATAVRIDDSIYRRAAAAAAAAEDEDEDSLQESLPPPSGSLTRSGFRTLNSKDAERKGEGFGHLARAITKFTEVYERVEAAKVLQMVELEKQRMEFSKMLEFHKMQLFVDYQVQVEKMKRTKRSDPDNYSKLDHRKGQEQAYGDLMR